MRRGLKILRNLKLISFVIEKPLKVVSHIHYYSGVEQPGVLVGPINLIQKTSFSETWGTRRSHGSNPAPAINKITKGRLGFSLDFQIAT